MRSSPGGANLGSCCVLRPARERPGTNSSRAGRPPHTLPLPATQHCCLLQRLVWWPPPGDRAGSPPNCGRRQSLAQHPAPPPRQPPTPRSDPTPPTMAFKVSTWGPARPRAAAITIAAPGWPPPVQRATRRGSRRPPTTHFGAHNTTAGGAGRGSLPAGAAAAGRWHGQQLGRHPPRPQPPPRCAAPHSRCWRVAGALQRLGSLIPPPPVPIQVACPGLVCLLVLALAAGAQARKVGGGLPVFASAGRGLQAGRAGSTAVARAAGRPHHLQHPPPPAAPPLRRAPAACSSWPSPTATPPATAAMAGPTAPPPPPPLVGGAARAPAARGRRPEAPHLPAWGRAPAPRPLTHAPVRPCCRLLPRLRRNPGPAPPAGGRVGLQLWWAMGGGGDPVWAGSHPLMAAAVSQRCPALIACIPAPLLARHRRRQLLRVQHWVQAVQRVRRRLLLPPPVGRPHRLCDLQCRAVLRHGHWCAPPPPPRQLRSEPPCGAGSTHSTARHAATLSPGPLAAPPRCCRLHQAPRLLRWLLWRPQAGVGCHPLLRCAAAPRAAALCTPAPLPPSCPAHPPALPGVQAPPTAPPTAMPLRMVRPLR